MVVEEIVISKSKRGLCLEGIPITVGEKTRKELVTVQVIHAVIVGCSGFVKG